MWIADLWDRDKDIINLVWSLKSVELWENHFVETFLSYLWFFFLTTGDIHRFVSTNISNKVQSGVMVISILTYCD